MEIYQTADMILAGFLLANDCHLARIYDDNPRHIRFEFENGEGLDALVASYTTGKAMVNAIIFAEKLAEVKSLLWKAKNKQRIGRNDSRKSFAK